jgi:hypothetical protein
MVRKTTTTKAPSEIKAKPRRTASAKAKPIVVESAPVVPSVTRQTKPVFRAGTWLAVLLLIALIGLTVYLKREKEKAVIAEATPVSEMETIFAADGIVSSIEIKPTDGETVKLARNAENAWVVKMPLEAEADQGLAEAAATQISALQVISRIDDGKSPSVFGFDTPAVIITIEFAGGKKRTLEVGDATPTNSGYYVRVDKDKMMVTDLSGIEALLQLGFFPPYLNTPTPTSLPPTLTPVPPTELPATPTP